MHSLPHFASAQGQTSPQAFSRPTVRTAEVLANRRAYAQAAFYAFHQNGLTFGLNQLTGRSQSLADKSGWLVNATA